MGLAHAWRRRGMWATAVTLVLPAALVLVAATTILGGGFRGLGAVGQVFTGPEVPEASLVHAPAAPARGGSRLPTVPAAPPLLDSGPARVGSPGVAPGGGAPAASSPLATAPPRANGPAPVAGTPAAPQPSAPPAQQASPPSPPANPVRQTGEAVASTVGALPAPAGPLGHDVVTTVLDIVVPGRAAVPPQP